jgi:DNA invertase Pin-like site-specific DNA recombinase
MKKAVLYGRISSRSDESLESQFVVLRKIATQRGFEIAAVYSDLASCSSKSKRAGIEALLRDARRGVFSVVLTSSLDRLGTSVKNCMELVRQLDMLSIGLISAKEAVDTATPDGRVFVAMLGYIEDLHKSHNRERIKGAMRRRKLDGLPIGRIPLCIDRGAVVADRLSGLSLSKTAQRYSISRTTVIRLVREAQRRLPATFTQLPRETIQRAQYAA